MSSISGISGRPSAPVASPLGRPLTRPEEPKDLETSFQQAVGGLLFGQLIKSLRDGVGKPAYIHGGQAEEMFQTQMDQKLAETLATREGGTFVKELYQRFLVDHPQSAPESLQSVSSLAQSAKSAPIEESAQDAAWARPTTSVSRNTTGTGVIPALYRK